MKTGTYVVLFNGEEVGSFRVDNGQVHDVAKMPGSITYAELKAMTKNPYYRIKKIKEVAAIAVISGNQLLMGVRRDNGKLTNPGGHIEEGESPSVGAQRELKEEVGLDGDLLYIGSEIVDSPEGRLAVYCYAKTGPKEAISFKLDPDGEMSEAYWVDLGNGIPASLVDELHVPLEKNVMLKLLLS